MSWEIYKTEYLVCPCKKGRICVERYADDWNQIDSHYTIECEFCKNEYHFETQSSYKPHHGSNTFLVRNGETASFSVYPKSFEEYLVHTYSKEELGALYSTLLVTTSSKIVCRSVVKEHQRWYKTTKMHEIRAHTKSAIDRYDTFEYNKKSIEQKREECREVERFYL
jgi:hypothetical protein